MKTNSFKRLLTIYFLMILGIIATLTSCVQTKQIVYFQGDTLKHSILKTSNPEKTKIHSGDLLGILVTSLSEESNTLFNAPNMLTFTMSNYSTNGIVGKNIPAGYMVDSDGFVHIPLVGQISVKDCTLNATAKLVENKLQSFVKNPVVSVKILNHKFTILGEVNRPSVYNFVEDRISLLEAIGMAGDLTIFGRRNNVLLIRELKSGESEHVRLDLTSKNLFSSPYYYIQNNDVVYVEPLKTKATVTDQNYQLVPIFTGIVSALGILILNIRR